MTRPPRSSTKTRERSVLEHKPVAVANRPHESRLLALRTADRVVWRPGDGRPLRAGDRIIVVATRTGLSRLLAESKAGSDAGPDTPHRLLQPWDVAIPRSSPERNLQATPRSSPERNLQATPRSSPERNLQERPGHRTPDTQPDQPPMAEGPADDRPIGPADADATRPA
jgi:hypothetical protein